MSRTIIEDMGSRKRLDIQALRAVAVMLVVATHVWPDRLSGGYVGVDVFFVISGYLITAHLLREVEATGQLSLARFWARRVRRLLPAAFTVLIFSVGAAVVVLPATAWPQTLREALASVLYVENWSLAFDSVDYMAAENDATMLQHFWSLSVEEQFYILWPLLILAALALRAGLTRRSLTVSSRKAVAVTLLVVAVLSLIASVVWTELSPSSAYFSTATRAWEFAAGGLLSFAPPAAALRAGRGSDALRIGAGWAGVALIAYAALRFDEATAFPGVTAAVPVLGAALLIWAGDSAHPWSPAFAGRFGPVQFVGDISYSVYLWHWPLVVLHRLISGGVPGVRDGALIVVGSLALGALSKWFVEDPFRRSAFWGRRPRRSFAFALAGLASTAVLVAAAGTGMNAQIAAASQERAPWASGPALQQEVMNTLSLDRFPTPDQPGGRGAQVNEWSVDRCVDVRTPEKRETCVYGDEESDKRLVVVGDSFGTSLLPALRGAFGAEYRIEPLTLGQCSPAFVETHSWDSKRVSQGCLDHRSDTLARVSADPPDLIVIVDATESTVARVLGADEPKARAELYLQGLSEAYGEYARLRVPTVVIESAPKTNCTAESSFTSPRDCAPTPNTDFALEVQERKRVVAEQAGIGFVTLSEWMCSPSGVCPNQIGHMVTRADGAHLTNTFSVSLTRIIRESVLAELREH
jgi:peptidoglycan/LPS O-acetylase OafA/YrhL/RNA polymerase subunit RPABC4/transcription elongation factor Spt4